MPSSNSPLPGPARRPLVLLVALLGAALFGGVLWGAAVVGAADIDADSQWPRWRGPLDTGVAPDADPPTVWSETRNVRFKVPVPGRGHASPVVWGDRIFLLTAMPAGEPGASPTEPAPLRFDVLALATVDGRELWRRTAVETTPAEGTHPDGTWAGSSPVTDGERLIAHFGSQGTFAYDLDGELLWSVDLGQMTTRNGFGEGSSPLLRDDRVVILWDHEGDSFLVALDAATGAEVWRVERPGEPTSWSTPVAVEIDGRTQVVVAATGRSRGYDLQTGEELWSLEGMTLNVIPTPPHGDGVVYLASGFRGNAVQAVDLRRARGELAETDAVLWVHDRHAPYVPSLLLYDDQVYYLKRFGDILTSADAATGEIHYTEVRLPGIGNIYSSPVAASGRVYFFDREGGAVVLRHGPTLELLAENELDEGAEATPALVGDTLYLRTRGYLYALQESRRAPAVEGAP